MISEENLKRCLEKIVKTKADWTLDGSCNLYVQGMNITMNDLDITTDKNGYTQLKKLLGEYIVKEAKKGEKNYAIYSYSNTEIEVSHYDLDDRIKYKQQIVWNGLKINTIPIPIAKTMYEKLGRTEKANLIARHLENL